MASKNVQVSLPTELSSYVRRKVAGGQYHDAADVVRDALRRMQATELAMELAQFEKAVAGGHNGNETEAEIDRIERAVKAGRR